VRAYICNRFPSFTIGSEIKFHGGLFVAQSEEQERIIESNDWFGVHVHRRDLDPEPPKTSGKKTKDKYVQCPVHGQKTANPDGSCPECFPPEKG
jgi:hypothetical protein